LGGGEIDLPSIIREELLRLRSIDRILHTENYSEAWLKASHQERTEAHRLVLLRDSKGLAKWIKGILYWDLLERPVRELRKLAQQLGIKNYHILTKSELLSELHGAASEIHANDAGSKNTN
jgi:hypothetical protein